MDLLEEIESVLGDAGGPGEFKYDGGPKPYVKKDGTTSKKSQERVDSVNEGQQAIPVPNQEQIAQAAALVQKYYDSKDSGILTEMQEAMKVYSDKAWSHGYGTPEYIEFQEKRETLYKQFKDILYPPSSTQESEEFQSGLENQQSQIKRLRDSIVENNPTTRYLSKDAKNFTQDEALTEEEHIALEYFIEDSSTLNQAILGNTASSYGGANWLNEAEEVSKAIQKFTLGNDIQVSRGIHSPKGTWVSEFLNAQPGDILHNKAFSSTSMGSKTAHEFKTFHGGDEEQAVLRISLKKGQHVLPINQTMSGIQSDDSYHQREVVIDKNSRFRVDSVNKKTRTVNLTFLDKNAATDSLAIDYTFIPEEHPRQKDPDWGGKPQEPGQPRASLNIVVPTPEAHAAAQKLVDKYYTLKRQGSGENYVDNRIHQLRNSGKREPIQYPKDTPSSLENGGSDLSEEDYNEFLDGASQEEVDALKELVPKAMKAMKEIDMSEGGVFGSQAAGEIMGPAGALTNSPIHQIHSILNAWHGEEQFPKYDFDPNSGELGRLEQWQEKSPEEHLEEQRSSNKEMLEHHISSGDIRGYGSIAKNIEQTQAINPSQEMAIVSYIGSEYPNIQNGLREGKLSQDLEETVNLISSAINSYSITDKMTVYRGIASQEMDSDYMKSLLNSEPGSIIHEKGFLSTTPDNDFAEEFAKGASISGHEFGKEVKGLTLEISLSKGQKALPMGLATKNTDQLQEILLNKDSQFRVEGINKQNRTIQLTHLGNNTTESAEPAEQAKSEKESDFSPEHEAEVKKLHDELVAEKPEVIKSIESRTDLTPQQREQRLSDVEKTYDSYKLQEESRNKITKQFGLTNRYSPPVYSGEQEAKAEHFSSPELTNEHHKLIDYFTRDSTPMNDYLHNESKSKNKTSERIKALSDLINSSKTNQDTRVFRGINSGLGDKERDELHEALLEAKPGEIINNKGFVSTTTYPDEGIRFAKTGTRKALLSISLKKGHPALHLSHGSMGDQGEVVLDKGTRFEIESVDKKNKVIKVSVIPNDKPITTDSVPLNSVDWRYANHQLQYVIETPKGTLRIGHGWQRRMPADYGYIVGFTGADGDEIDCYLGPNPWSQIVYVVDQNQINSKIFDEHKCLIGFASESEAKRCYLMGHHMGDKIFRGIKALSMREFINWLQRGNLTQPITR